MWLNVSLIGEKVLVNMADFIIQFIIMFGVRFAEIHNNLYGFKAF